MAEVVIKQKPLHPIWIAYRRRRRLPFVLLLSGPATFLVIDRALRVIGYQLAGELFVACFLGWGVAFAISMWRWMLFACPRCRGLFHIRGFVSSPFSVRCLRCGFPKWKDPPDI